MRKLTSLLSATILSFAMSTVFATDLMQDTKEAGITTEVKALLAEKEMSKVATFSASEIHVTTENDVVTLTGQVKNDQEKAQAEELAKSVNGVANVQNNLTVQGSQ